MKCNETLSKWCKNKHGASKIIDMFETYQQPKPGDPREHMHQAAIQSLGLVEDRLRKHPPERKATYHKEAKGRTQAPTFAKQNKRVIR
jgi:hypothetical protein